MTDASPMILVVEDVEETRDGIECLLRSDGYRVHCSRGEEDAVATGRRERPDLILISAGAAADVVGFASRIRQCAGLIEDVPVVIFCMQTVEEGAEVGVGRSIHITRPDNFNQLRNFLRRLLGARASRQ